MDFHQVLNKLTGHVVFKHWHADHTNYFLAHAFKMLDDANKNEWQIGFYSLQDEQMVTFIVNGAIQKIEDQEVLKSKQVIEPLKTQDVALDMHSALQKGQECFNENYQGIVAKQFFIIQQYDNLPIYNITYFLGSFETVNIKINAKTGEIIKHDRQKLLEFG